MSYRKFNIAFSTCPNDTFMFDALVNKRLKGIDFSLDVHLADIEELNKMAVEGSPDITKISYAAYPAISEKYQLMSSGSALGYKNGPLIISKRKIYPDELSDIKMAIPGKMTTANFLLSILFPEVKNKSEYLFSDIEEAVLSNEVDAGLVIHETRFVYKEKGLKLVSDLGELWEKKFDLPIPLGGIVVRRDLPREVKINIQKKISESIQYAFGDRHASMQYIKQHAQDLKDEVVNKHIDLYVNDFSIDLGKKGREAVEKLFSKGEKAGLFELKDRDIFVGE
ncbi:MAG: 1,4-dihydroxy-6-naphthoate synthase [Bacteroidales bacterium]|nr:1,4-dihydroxy-6-naphthoate synthase [Bacteroidales bacterium]MCF8389728.1 1,4-dihydroxy-6-naphthoate synthase [Bacteroidales bacterium]